MKRFDHPACHGASYSPGCINKEYDARHPVFDKTCDDVTLSLACFITDKSLFDSREWWTQASIIWVDQDSNIVICDEFASAIIAGAQCNF